MHCTLPETQTLELPGSKPSVRPGSSAVQSTKQRIGAGPVLGGGHPGDRRDGGEQGCGSKGADPNAEHRYLQAGRPAEHDSA